ncbi:hypothetical protein Desal_1680 [Maridesulfovibrio salexigens DSM 2638]|uniref:Uncharacterized protein n=1 Tax=Maridesulfovibrio salexigens (strain ATCC 14822 / DSM 2638 / NCIMB 8403 / VKM B-1763) TaxID=526222 RepID=C6BT38_MARSD|nr:hypothetical protein Desal_1680 [Maridesulfovibrio salexigens DSM 2638]
MIDKHGSYAEKKALGTGNIKGKAMTGEQETLRGVPVNLK